MKIAIAQINPIIGDFEGNAQKVIAGYNEAVTQGAEIVVTSELVLWGYPPGDLLLDAWRYDAHDGALQKAVRAIGDVPMIIGATKKHYNTGKGVYNTALFVRNGQIISEQYKMLLPTYDIFDEHRYFDPNPEKSIHVVQYKSQRIGMLICEDLWGGTEEDEKSFYDTDPVEIAAKAKLDILITLNASPYHWGKGDVRVRLVQKIAQRCACPVVYGAQVGANTELIFDGRSMFVDANGRVKQMTAYREEIAVCDMCDIKEMRMDDSQDLTALYDALVLGVRDYYQKSGLFSGAVLGLSGGIDSALTFAIAADALGSENIKVFSLPSRYTADMSNDDARNQAKVMGVSYDVIPISPAVKAFSDMLSASFAGKDIDVTEENIQARSRGIVLMALSNKENRLLLTTGNKSEMAVGYATLYGDMAGGLAVIADVPKTLVYALARYRNSLSPVIPKRVLTREPSAELAPNQLDRNTLPPYDVLDPILEAYIEERISPQDIVNRGYDATIVRDVCWRVDCNEYKRRQAAPVLRVTSKAFGSGRRYPIVAKY